MNVKILLNNTQDIGFHIFCSRRTLQQELSNIDFTNLLNCTLKACLLIGALWLGVCTLCEVISGVQLLRKKLEDKYIFYKIFVYDMCEITSGVQSHRKKLSDKGRSLPTFSLFQPMDKKSKSIVIKALNFRALLLCELTFMRH